MNREIKFRAWKNPQADAWGMFDWEQIKNEWILDGSFIREMLPGRDGWIVMQYTGLKDKNGKEIYGGDIIKFEGKDELGVVIWSKGLWGYSLSFPELNIKDEELPICSWIEYGKIPFEIIGNIYENPELLVKEKV